MESCKATVSLGNIAIPICKNCIKADVCEIAKEFENNPVEGMFIGGCDYFKDRSKFIELPCKVGDKVYFVYKDEIDENAINGFVISEPVKITEVGTRGFWTSEVSDEESDDMDDFTPWAWIGEEVFLTREEAERALRENGE